MSLGFTCRLHYRAEHAHHDFFDVWSSKVREFKEFGVGHMMYFHFLSWMAALFGVLAVITGIPNMALNYFGRCVTAAETDISGKGSAVGDPAGAQCRSSMAS